MSFKTLVLNADYKPLSYFPLSICNWKESIKAVFLEKVSVVSEYNEIVRSPSIKIKIPSVIALKEYVICSRKPAFTRFNVFLRDEFKCQYCNSSKLFFGITYVLSFSIFVTPIGILMRFLGKDLLNTRKINNASTYWIKRDKQHGTMKKQF